MWRGDSPFLVRVLGAVWLQKYHLYVYLSAQRAYQPEIYHQLVSKKLGAYPCVVLGSQCYSSILILLPSITASTETRLISFNTGSIFQFAVCVVVGGIGTSGLVALEDNSNSLCLVVALYSKRLCSNCYWIFLFEFRLNWRWRRNIV